MDSFGGDMRFEMEEVPPHSHPQTSLEPSSLYTTRINSQHSVTLPQRFPALDERLNDSMNFAWAEPNAIFPPETLLRCPAFYVNGSIIPPDHTSAQNLSSFRQNNISFQTQNVLSVLDQPFNRQRPAQFLTRKRAPKAPTMSTKNWKPHKNRIRQIYVIEGKTIGELREIMNKELGITATLRQYKVQIQQMKLERNVKAKERKAVINHIQHRSHAVGRKSSHVRVRGHEINQEKLSRWAKENLMDQPSMSANPPSPLPSCMSIYTNSVCETLKQASPVILKHQRLVNGFTTASDMTSTLIQRLLKYTQSPKHMIESQEAQALFNDLQLILSSDYTAGKRWNEDHWNPTVKEDIIQVRNLMNVTQTLLVSGESKETHKFVSFNEIRDRDTDLSKTTNRYAAWITPYGRVEASFWAVSNGSNLDTGGDATRIANKTVAAKLAIVPSSIGTFPFRVVFDFTPHLDPSATITYQAMIANDSEVFKIAGSGEVKELIQLLEGGTVSLTDRDEEGRSLLNYAMTGSNADMCKFLVDKKADINAIELCWVGYIGPVHSIIAGLDSEIEEIERNEHARCTRIMLEAGADISLEEDRGDGCWVNSFIVAVQGRSLATLKHMCEFGEPFISRNGIYKTAWGECSALTTLTHYCGYSFVESIDVVDKAILLLNRKADISCRDENGDTVLHKLLKCKRYHEGISKTMAHISSQLHFWRLSFKAPKDLLMVFITAGADVYATNDKGETPSMVASEYGREDEWIEALKLCGYAPEEVLASCIHRPTRENQTFKLSFQEYCQQRRQRQHPGPFEGVESEDSDNDSQYNDENEYEEVQSEDSDDSQYGDGDAYKEDDHKEIRVITDNTECVDGSGGNMEIFGGVECADHGIDIGLDNEGNEHTCNGEEMADHQVLGVDDMVDNDIEGMDVNFDDWLDNGMDFMQSFIDFETFLDTPFE